MSRVEELEEAIREALDEFERLADGDPTLTFTGICTKLESALISDDTIIELTSAGVIKDF